MLAPAVHDLVSTLHPQIRTIAREAGEIALDSFRPGRQTAARIWTKDKGSPVTEADVAVDTFLKIRLSGLVPEAGWLSEETADNPDRLTRRLVWIVDAFARRAGSSIEHLPKIPSLALRLARVADGSVDIGLVSGNSRDWDLAAADLILHEAGGRVSDLDGRDLRYNRTEPVHGELAAAPARLLPGVLEAMRAPAPNRP